MLRHLHKNPPSPGFRSIGSGARATAYIKKKVVELILCPPRLEYDRYITYHKQVVYDLSREVMIRARELVAPFGLKHLPDIRRKRIDLGRVEVWNERYDVVGTVPMLEFIYEMEYLKDRGYRNPNPSVTKLLALEANTITDLHDRLAYSDLPDKRSLRAAISAITMAAAEFKMKVHLDLHDFNLNTRDDGTIVLRDIIVVDGFLRNRGQQQGILDLWKRAGFTCPYDIDVIQAEQQRALGFPVAPQKKRTATPLHKSTSKGITSSEMSHLMQLAGLAPTKKTVKQSGVSRITESEMRKLMKIAGLAPVPA